MVNKIIFISLSLVTIFYIGIWFRDILNNRITKVRVIPLAMIASITSFFDTMGIGNFAPSLALISTFRLSDEKTLPGTLNVGIAVPSIIEAFIFIKEIKVDGITLIALIASATLGSILGAMFVSSLSGNMINKVVGVALLVMAMIMIFQKANVVSFGGTATGLRGSKLAIAIVGNFILGSLMTAGIGLYAPCMFMVAILGMNQKVAFPIMMGSCAFVMPAASIKFIKNGAYDRGASLIISIFGSLGVILGSKIVTSLSVEFIKYIVIFVIIYGGIFSLRKVKKYR